MPTTIHTERRTYFTSEEYASIADALDKDPLYLRVNDLYDDGEVSIRVAHIVAVRPLGV